MKNLVLAFLSENGYNEDNILAKQFFFEDVEIKDGFMYEMMFLSKSKDIYEVRRVIVIDKKIRFECDDDLLGGSYVYELCECDQEAIENFLCDVEGLLEFME